VDAFHPRCKQRGIPAFFVKEIFDRLIIYGKRISILHSINLDYS
jgi:hypothetical protein